MSDQNENDRLAEQMADQLDAELSALKQTPPGGVSPDTSTTEIVPPSQRDGDERGAPSDKPAPAVMSPAKRDRAAERVRRAERAQASVTSGGNGEHSGGSVDYYKLRIEHPTHMAEPYEVECNDIIEALQMDYAEGNVFKAIWRTAAARMGKHKRGHDAKYDAEKIVFFGQRLLERAKRNLKG